MPQSLAKLYTHPVFSTQHRRNLIDGELRQSLHAYMAGILNKHGCPCLLINSMPDHIHVLFLLSRTVSLSAVVKELKAGSSNWVHENYPDRQGFYWQAGYAAFSVSQSGVPAVSEYIANQQKAHAELGYQGELRILLQRHQIEFDERYLWD